jgi:hypothetical protein
LAITVAVFEMLAEFVGTVTTFNDTLALVPVARLPRVHTTVWALVQLPWLVVGAAWRATLLVSGSVMVTPVAVSGPLFVTVIV